MTVFINQVNSLLHQEKQKSTKIEISLHDSLVRRTLATSPRQIEFHPRQTPLPSCLSEALRVARVAKGEPPPAPVSPLGQIVLFTAIG